MSLLYLVLVLVSISAFTSAASQRTMTVRGRMRCGKQAATPNDTWVALLNKRTGSDDKVQKAVNADGSYTLTLTVNRMFNMDPEIHIYTDCNDSLFGVQKGCQRKLVLKVPDKYVNSGTYDAGEMNLESQLKDESRDCSTVRSWGFGQL